MADGTVPTVKESLASAFSAAAAASPEPSPAASPSPSPSPAPSGDPGSRVAPESATVSRETPAAAGADAPKGMVRGPDGKFVAKPSDAAPLAPPADGQAKPPTDSTAKPKDAAPDTGAPILPPHGWGKDAGEWSALPRSVQLKIETRERDRDRALSQERNKLQSAQRRYDALEQVIGPRRERMIAETGSEAGSIARLLQLSDYAAAAPEAFLQWFAQQRGIDLGKLVAGAPEPAAVDPHLAPLQTELGQLKQAVIQIGTHLRNTAQQSDTRQQGAVLSTIDQWAAEKDHATGELKRPYYERLETWIARIMPQVTAENPGRSPTELLDIAYDHAVYAHPETRAALTQQAEAKRLAEQRAREAKAAESARLAGTSITGGSAPNAGSVPAKTVQEEMRRVADSIRGRAA